MAINLQKGQKISLNKESGTTLTSVVMGLGWDAKKVGGKAIDLDASCVLFDEQNRKVDQVFFGQLKSKDGSIRHTGDNLTGAGDGDDEQINVDLSSVPASVKSLVFVVNSFSGQTFDSVENAYCRLLDGGNKSEIARYTLTAQGAHTAQIMAKLYRHNDEWKMHAIGENGTGRTLDDLLSQITPHL